MATRGTVDELPQADTVLGSRDGLTASEFPTRRSYCGGGPAGRRDFANGSWHVHADVCDIIHFSWGINFVMKALRSWVSTGQ